MTKANSFLDQFTLFGVVLLTCLGASRLVAQDDLDPAMLSKINPAIAEAEYVDMQLAVDSGLSVYSSKHLLLISDIRDDAKAKDLIKSFDAAVPQWCDYFGIDADKTKGWKLRAYLIQGIDKLERFQKANLLTKPLPSFAAGYQVDHNIYLYDQPGPYYTRHLLLHEGTHAFMQWFLSGYGKPWYSEGMSEMMGVHSGSGDSVKLMHRLKNRSEAPYWGRVKLIKDEYRDGKAMTLDDVLSIPNKSFRNVRYYAWAWAGCKFFNNHPLTKDAFLELRGMTSVRQADEFDRAFKATLSPHWEQLSVDWSIFVSEMEYGYDVEKGRVTEAKASPTEPTERFTIESEKCWQSTGVPVKAGQQFKVSASGKFKIGQSVQKVPAGSPSDTEPKIYPWRSEANGITIEYYRGQPLGRLLVGVLPADIGGSKDGKKELGSAGLVEPAILAVSSKDSSGVYVMPADGVLCFRINDSPSKLADNQGALDVRCQRLQ